jgi:hypothetical protein
LSRRGSSLTACHLSRAIRLRLRRVRGAAVRRVNGCAHR